ncbi:hypothetical protein [Bremerella sp. P1]|uniref:hypothetical protein n=1 Tax=Bremerella sp. P1 TaxID=3026424 RepID=UPI00236824EB|nr:hypothetical protein [Bremerella sp. P1]WDI45151.1 hypothetical protein PSR63_14535 [Bremerella sp. P1]
MKSARKLLLLVPVIAFGLLTFTYAAPPAVDSLSNSYYLYTGALDIKDSGVVPVPSRYQWSVETSWRGIDAGGNELPDTRIMLRLYDPEHNFTALTAQMDLATATKLQQELSAIIEKKRQNPAFQYRPKHYDAKDIPRMEFIGVDKDGVAILREVTDK